MKRSNLVVFTLVLAALLMSFGSDVVMSQTANIKVIALSPRDIADGGLTSPPSSGLKNVGQGELVYLMGGGASSDTVTAFSWSLEAPLPAGSAAVLDSFTTQMTTFIPDTVGHFVVKLQITTAAGTHDTTITINSAHYVGVGGMETSLPTNTAIGQCGQCHFGNTSEWMGTGHASMLETMITGLGGSYYTSNCISCHVVGYDTAPTAINGGFDDVATALGWTFPATLTPANWDTALVIDRPNLAHLGNIQCENCHGPGSLHFGNPANIDVSVEVGVCAECHDSGSHHVFPMQWANSVHSTEVSDHAAHSSSCGVCHSTYGFIKKVDPTAAADPDWPASGVGAITCAACHDPHSAENAHQLRTLADVTLGNGVVVTGGGYGQLCMNCHISRRDAVTYAEAYHSHYGPHYSNQTDMLVGTNAITFGMHIPSSTHSKVIENTCVTCHMADTPAHGEAGENLIGSHTFAMETVDATTGAVTHNVAGCQSCHGAITSFDDIMAKADYDGDGSIESAQHEILGLLDVVGMLLPPLDDPAVTVANTYTPVQLKAAYNYEFVADDRSKGVHNYSYALNLLKVAHAALTTGDLGAGAISEISDIPNDQGKQVRVVWGGFGGDGIATMPITNYSLWRRVDVMAKGSLKKDIPIFASREQLLTSDPSNLKIGARVMAGDELWDFAGQVPATGMDSYSAVAPTLYDSTAANGKQLSFFVVTGHTSNPALYFMSVPDSGYSIDNLAPSAPANFAVAESVDGALLSWDESLDEDLKYFSVYRGTTANFDPTSSELLETTTETSFTDADIVVNSTYYYKVSASDFSGNQSFMSKEVSLLVTKVVSTFSGVPDDFTLMQNFPNPFNPSTEITFGLPKDEQITIAVYNVLGARIRTLAEGKFSAGYHNFTWDASDEFGNAVAPGMYFYRLQSRSQTLTKKMILIK